MTLRVINQEAYAEAVHVASDLFETWSDFGFKLPELIERLYEAFDKAEGNGYEAGYKKGQEDFLAAQKVEEELPLSEPDADLQAEMDAFLAANPAKKFDLPMPGERGGNYPNVEPVADWVDWPADPTDALLAAEDDESEAKINAHIEGSEFPL